MHSTWLATELHENKTTTRAGRLASLEPCEALSQLATAALEVAAEENKPRMCIVPMFPTAGWRGLATGFAPPPLPSQQRGMLASGCGCA